MTHITIYYNSIYYNNVIIKFLLDKKKTFELDIDGKIVFLL
jgi:hypothetical protein